MNPETTSAAGEAAAPAWRSRRARLVGAAVGVLVFAAAVWAVAGQREAVGRAWESLRAAPGWMIAALALLPALNLLLTAGVLTVLTRRHARVPYAEMFALIASAWLLNYLPLRPGLLGRVAYHRLVNGIPVSRSLRVIGEAIGCGAASLVMLVAAGAAAARLGSGGPADLALVAAPGLATLALWSVWPRGAGDTRRLLLAASIKYADTLVWVLRYWLVFRAIGAPVGLGGAAASAAVAQAVLLIPVVGNGLGVREWAVGAVSSAMPAAAGALKPTVAVGLMADLANRAAEMTAALPLGLAATAWLAGRLRRARRHAEAPPAPAPIKTGA